MIRAEIESNPYQMPIDEIIARVTEISRRHGVRRLDLFGSFARGDATERSKRRKQTCSE